MGGLSKREIEEVATGFLRRRIDIFSLTPRRQYLRTKLSQRRHCDQSNNASQPFWFQSKLRLNCEKLNRGLKNATLLQSRRSYPLASSYSWDWSYSWHSRDSFGWSLLPFTRTLTLLPPHLEEDVFHTNAEGHSGPSRFCNIQIFHHSGLSPIDQP